MYNQSGFEVNDALNKQDKHSVTIDGHSQVVDINKDVLFFQAGSEPAVSQIKESGFDFVGIAG